MEAEPTTDNPNGYGCKHLLQQLILILLQQLVLVLPMVLNGNVFKLDKTTKLTKNVWMKGVGEK